MLLSGHRYRPEVKAPPISRLRRSNTLWRSPQQNDEGFPPSRSARLSDLGGVQIQDHNSRKVDSESGNK
ncbi:hypothetical protein TNCT_425201 [Trichonephila clavata]|uniref:Uncharacterized protein n=1 Tax=Trichonephila clavata TaxID=2740835 RepID=A0A8X6GC20_TRICU|nr:hypothetical protein TNCT_425201 [Trichonephila clavata]